MTILQPPQRTGSLPTVLLVHDAFADASSWAGVIPLLQTAGLEVLAPANPLRGLATDAAYLASVVGEIDGPVLLVGHAYGGAVITVAGAQAENVSGLVYVAGFALDAGESALDIGTRFPARDLAPTLRPTTSVHGGVVGVELSIWRDAFPQVFAADLPAEVSTVLAVSQRPLAAAACEEKAAAAAWRTLPSWYIVATEDRSLSPEAQRFMALRAGALASAVGGSHAITLSQPAAVADLIRAAADR